MDIKVCPSEACQSPSRGNRFFTEEYTLKIVFFTDDCEEKHEFLGFKSLMGNITK